MGTDTPIPMNKNKAIVMTSVSNNVNFMATNI